MEDGDLTVNNAKSEIMANYPDIAVTAIKNKNVADTNNSETNKHNGEPKQKEDIHNDVVTSDDDVLVIDEEQKTQKSKKAVKRKRSNSTPEIDFKGFKKRILVQSDTKNTKSSEGELHTENSEKPKIEVKTKPKAPQKYRITQQNKLNVKKSKKPSPKLTEYAQYLGLQPTVKFKCCKCADASFPTLGALNNHQRQCVALPQSSKPAPQTSPFPSTNFRVTRKVFLCSACGTYYENWNLFLHMREVHKRFICLYCLGMFSFSDKLSQHLVAKHNCIPNKYPTSEDFFNSFKEACFLMCCNCEKVFSERDNFFGHVCEKKVVSEKQCASCHSNVKNGSQSDVNNKSKNESEQKPDEILPTPTEVSDTPDVSESVKEESEQEVEETTDNSKLELNETKVEPDPQLTEPSTVENLSEEESAIAPEPKSTETQSEESPELTKPLPTNENTNTEIHSPQSPNENEVPTTSDNNSLETNEITSTEENQDTHEMTDAEKLSEPDLKETEQDEEEDQYEDPFEEPLTPDSDSEQQEEMLENSENEARNTTEELVEEVRKVPKVTLKLPQNLTAYSDNESDDSDKLTMDESQEKVQLINGLEENGNKDYEPYQIAGDDTPIVELTLEQPLDKIPIEKLLKLCLSTTVHTCVYCNHARKISVNGKQLGLHTIAEHRYAATVDSITAEELIPDNFVSRITESFSELEEIFFTIENQELIDENKGERSYECFQCRYVTGIHKELYLHNRKMHAKTILLCIICKSNFYSYSELICHLCPGTYILNSEIKFQCCMCEIRDLPSAFRLMVHLRKKHHTCDVCLEPCNNQSKLSNHVWKHKLHHLCYRCGIAYRNKPDITKHLFWKHGTQSVLCKKCLQKKWPHVYHFCIPPLSFVCEECNLSFSKAVYLKVHKRLHSNEKPHVCLEDDCREAFISRKLLEKHDRTHREPEILLNEAKLETDDAPKSEIIPEESSEVKEDSEKARESNSPEKEEQKKMNIIDAIPELNLSESSDSDSDEEPQTKLQEDNPQETLKPTPIISETIEEKQPENIPDNIWDEPVQKMEETETKSLDNIWDDFKNYQAQALEKQISLDKPTDAESECEPKEDVPNIEVILADHDYCVGSTTDQTSIAEEKNNEGDHDYCTDTTKKEVVEQLTEQENKKKKKTTSSSSDSSSDSDSSSCTCGSNCSCSSSSGSSSSSSSSSDSESTSSEGKRRSALKRERRKQRTKRKKDSENSQTTGIDVINPPQPVEIPIQESDLDTHESETDEDFYDEYPQRLANQIIAEKRNQLMLLATTPPMSNGSLATQPLTPPAVIPEEIQAPRKKIKTKKRKKEKRKQEHPVILNHIEQHIISQPPIPVVTIHRERPVENMSANQGSGSETDSNVRSSKRRRVPNKFYGYSSDEEANEKQQTQIVPTILKWRKTDLPSPANYIPPITIKNIPSPAPVIDYSRSDPDKHHTSAESTEDSDSEGQLQINHLAPEPPPICAPGPSARPPTESLYCYCQCPYDEVSEMIACDGKDCAIEWFHFECVGIMVPPRGKWYCPDCRKKAQPRNNDLLHV